MTKKFVTGISTQGAITIQGPNSPISLPTGGNGTSGQVLTSTGTGTTPSWQNALTLSSTAQQLFLASPASGSGVPSFRYITTSDFTQSSSPSVGQALVAAPVTGGWSWSTVITQYGGSLTGTLGITGTLAQTGTASPITLNGSAGTTGQVLTSAGTGATPTWVTPGATAWTGFKAGYYYNAQGGVQTNATPTLNTMTLVPFALSVSATFTKIGIYVNTAGAAGAVVRLGIYSSTDGVPSTRLLDAGTVATTTSSALALITINQTLTPGLYWLAAVPQVTTCSAQCKGAGFTPMVPFTGTPGNSNARGLQVSSVTGALPTPVGTLAMSATPFEVFLQL